MIKADEYRAAGTRASTDVERALHLIRPLGYTSIVYTYPTRRGLAALAKRTSGTNGLTVTSEGCTIRISRA